MDRACRIPEQGRLPQGQPTSPRKRGSGWWAGVPRRGSGLCEGGWGVAAPGSSLLCLKSRGQSVRGTCNPPAPVLQSCSQALAVPGRAGTLHGAAPSSGRGAWRAQVWARVGTRAPCRPADCLQSLGALWPLRPAAWPCPPVATLRAESPRVPWACPSSPLPRVPPP